MFHRKRFLLLVLSPWDVQCFVPASSLSVTVKKSHCRVQRTSKQGVSPPRSSGSWRRFLGVGEQYDNEEDLLDFAIDSFLRGDYDRQFSDDAPAPHPGLTPQTTVEAALQSLRKLDDPEPSHGAAVLMRFSVPLSRGERWGDSSSSSNGAKGRTISWKEVLRGAITPTMLARRIRASEFSCLLDWERLDVTEGAFSVKRDDGIEMGLPSSVAFVNTALFFGGEGEGVAPILVQFTLRKINGVWLIDSARLSPKGLFVENGGDFSKENQ